MRTTLTLIALALATTLAACGPSAQQQADKAKAEAAKAADAAAEAAKAAAKATEEAAKDAAKKAADATKDAAAAAGGRGPSSCRQGEGGRGCCGPGREGCSEEVAVFKPPRTERPRIDGSSAHRPSFPRRREPSVVESRVRGTPPRAGMTIVVPAKAVNASVRCAGMTKSRRWIPACAGMTNASLSSRIVAPMRCAIGLMRHFTAARFAIHRVSGRHCSQSCSPRERGRSKTLAPSRAQ